MEATAIEVQTKSNEVGNVVYQQHESSENPSKNQGPNALDSVAIFFLLHGRLFGHASLKKKYQVQSDLLALFEQYNRVRVAS